MADPPIRHQVMKYLAEQFPGATLADHQFGADGLLAIFDAEAARVCVEAVAEWAQIVAVIEQYLPEALPFNSLSEIVGGIARQRDLQHELKDHLAEVARRLTDERDAAVTRAIADERQRIVAEVSAPVFTRSLWAVLRGSITAGDSIESIAECVVEEICSLAVAGSVPVATPEPKTVLGPGTIVRRVATPTEPPSDELLDRWAAAVTLPGEYAAQLVDEVRRLRAAMASPVPAEQPPTCAHRQLCSYPNCRHVDSRVWPAAEQPEER